MAAHYRAEPQKIYAFLQRAKAARYLLAEQIGLTVKATRRADRRTYGAWRTRYDHSRLLAEAQLLSEIREGGGFARDVIRAFVQFNSIGAPTEALSRTWCSGQFRNC